MCVRRSDARICQRYQATDGLIRAFILSPDAERTIQNSIQFVENSQQLMLDPNQSKALQNNLSEALQRHRGSYLDPVIVVNGRIRRHVKARLERNFANMGRAQLLRGRRWRAAREPRDRRATLMAR